MHLFMMCSMLSVRFPRNSKTFVSDGCCRSFAYSSVCGLQAMKIRHNFCAGELLRSRPIAGNCPHACVQSWFISQRSFPSCKALRCHDDEPSLPFVGKEFVCLHCSSSYRRVDCCMMVSIVDCLCASATLHEHCCAVPSPVLFGRKAL